MGFWDRDANEKSTRTLWQWGNASAHFWSKQDEPKMPKRARAERSRRVAEMAEGVSSKSDDDGLGFLRPFGSARTGGMQLRIFKRKKAGQ